MPLLDPGYTGIFVVGKAHWVPLLDPGYTGIFVVGKAHWVPLLDPGYTGIFVVGTAHLLRCGDAAPACRRSASTALAGSSAL